MRNDVRITDKDVSYDKSLKSKVRGMGHEVYKKYKTLSYHVVTKDFLGRTRVRLKPKGKFLLKKIHLNINTP